MSTSVTSPNEFNLVSQSFLSKLRDIQDSVNSGALRSESELTHAVQSAYVQALDSLTTPERVDHPLDAFDVRDASLFNKSFGAIQRNAEFLLNGQDRLSTTIVQMVNHQQGLSEKVQAAVNKAASTTLDLRLFSNDLRDQIVIAGDDFRDRSKIDDSRSDNVDLLPFSGGLSLLRTGAESVRDGVNITVSAPATTYEGKRFGKLVPPNVNPEGQAFRFKVVAGSFSFNRVDGVSAELRSRFDTLVSLFESNDSARREAGLDGKLTVEVGLSRATSQGQFAGLTRDEWEQLAGNFHFEREFVQTAAQQDVSAFTEKSVLTPEDDDRSITAFNSRIYIEHAPEDELQDRRQRMLDDSPDSYWEIEQVHDTDEEFNRVRFNQDTGGPVPEKNLEDLTKSVQARFDPVDLKVDLVFDFGTERTVNFLSILPVQYSSHSFTEVTGLSWSLDGVTFQDIPEIVDGRFETKLVDGVNAELSEGERIASFAPDKFDMSGRGIFTFAGVHCRYLRLSLKETVPIPVEYQVVRAILSRTVTTKIKVRKLFKTKRRTITQHFSKAIELDAEQSLFLGVGDTTREDFLGTTDFQTEGDRGVGEFDAVVGAGVAVATDAVSSTAANVAATTTFGTTLLNAIPIAGQVAAAIDIVAGGAIGKSLGKFLDKSGIARTIGKVLGFSSKVRTNDTGWQLKELLLISKQDKSRYAIGVRDVQINKYTYVPNGSLVSNPFRTPKPIHSIALEVDESVPQGVDLRDSVKYEISLDNGTSWTSISPLRARPVRVSGGSSFVPQLVHVNSQVPIEQRDPNIGYVDLSGPAQSVRLKISFDNQGDTEKSPVVKSYRMKLILKDEL